VERQGEGRHVQSPPTKGSQKKGEKNMRRGNGGGRGTEKNWGTRSWGFPDKGEYENTVSILKVKKDLRRTPKAGVRIQEGGGYAQKDRGKEG